MKTRLLKKLRNEAYERFGAACRVEFGEMHYHVDTRENLKKYLDRRNEYPYTEIAPKLRVWRRQFIIDRIRSMREKEWEKKTLEKVSKM